MTTLLPKRFGDTTVLQATFAADHFQPSRRFLCLFVAQGHSSKPRWISAPADNDEIAFHYLAQNAGLTEATARALIAHAHQTEESFAALAATFIPAGNSR